MTDEHDRIIPAAEAQPRLAPVVAQALAQAPTPEVIRELLAVQREWEAGEARRSYTRALVDLHRDLPEVIARDQTVDYRTAKGGRTRYTHTSLAQVMMEIREPLTRHGFSLAWEPATSERQVTVTCRLTHRDGHSESTQISAPPDTSGGKSPPQAVASTITLLERYTALALLGIATADMAEPTGDQSNPDAIDAARNLRAAAHIRTVGRSVEDAEELVGRPTAEWTHADLRRIRAWLEEEATP